MVSPPLALRRRTRTVTRVPYEDDHQQRHHVALASIRDLQAPSCSCNPLGSYLPRRYKNNSLTPRFTSSAPATLPPRVPLLRAHSICAARCCCCCVKQWKPSLAWLLCCASVQRGRKCWGAGSTPPPPAVAPRWPLPAPCAAECTAAATPAHNPVLLSHRLPWGKPRLCTRCRYQTRPPLAPMTPCTLCTPSRSGKRPPVWWRRRPSLLSPPVWATSRKSFTCPTRCLCTKTTTWRRFAWLGRCTGCCCVRPFKPVACCLASTPCPRCCRCVGDNTVSVKRSSL